jgi:hemerythrin-like domain-containing protein
MPPVFVHFGAPRESSFASPLALLSECHRRIERFLADMTRVAVERRGGELSEPDRTDLAGAVRYFREAAPRHTADEEESLFPRMRSASDPQARQALAELDRLEADHERADAGHAEANALAIRWLNEGHLDEQGANRLIEVLSVLGDMYREHIAVEDSAVFPAAAASLPSAEIEAVGREMAARRGLDFDRVTQPLLYGNQRPR